MYHNNEITGPRKSNLNLGGGQAVQPPLSQIIFLSSSLVKTKTQKTQMGVKKECSRAKLYGFAFVINAENHSLPPSIRCVSLYLFLILVSFHA